MPMFNDGNHQPQPLRGNLLKLTTDRAAEQMQTCSNALVAVGVHFLVGTV
jgi:hypothetical protein